METRKSLLLVIYALSVPSQHELLPRTWKLAADPSLETC